MPEFNAYPLQLSTQSHYIQAGLPYLLGFVVGFLKHCHK